MIIIIKEYKPLQALSIYIFSLVAWNNPLIDISAIMSNQIFTPWKIFYYVSSKVIRFYQLENTIVH